LSIRRSKKILISLSTNSVPSKNLKGRNILPFRSQPIDGEIEIFAEKGLQLSYINNRGVKTTVPVKYTGRNYVINLSEFPQAHWLSLSRDN
jgi:hypothetical protein